MSAALPTELRLFLVSGCIARHPTRRRRCASLCHRRRIVADGTCRIRGTGLEPALRGPRPLVPIRLHHPLSIRRSTAGEIRTPDPLVRSQVLSSAELRRRIGVDRRVPCLRRGVVEHRARAGGLHEPIDERDQRDLHPHPSGRQPVAPLLSYGPSVVRLRRDVTADAPSSGSRVNPLPIAPCHAGRRCSTVLQVLRVLPRPSVVKQRFQDPGCRSLDSLRSLGMTSSVIPSAVEGSALRPFQWVKRERPTWLLAQAGRVEPLRSDDRVDALWRVPTEPGPCTTVSCVERSVTEPARPAARHFTHMLLLSISRLPQRHAALGIDDVGRRLRTGSHRADGRAPARGEPVLAGVPWACDGEMRERGHGIRLYERIVMELQWNVRKREIAPPMIARHTSVGVGPTHTPVA
jgi:hypothetical protein